MLIYILILMLFFEMFSIGSWVYCTVFEDFREIFKDNRLENKKETMLIVAIFCGWILFPLFIVMLLRVYRYNNALNDEN